MHNWYEFSENQMSGYQDMECFGQKYPKFGGFLALTFLKISNFKFRKRGITTDYRCISGMSFIKIRSAVTEI